MKDIGEKLLYIKKSYETLDIHENELLKLKGKMVVTNDNSEIGFISEFNFETGEMLVEFGLRTSTSFGIKFYKSSELIDGMINLA